MWYSFVCRKEKIAEPEVKTQFMEGSGPITLVQTTMEELMISPVFKSFLAGSFSGTCSTVLFQPLDLLKTKLQAPVAVGNKPSGLLQTLVVVVRNDRLLGLWRGMTPSITRTIPGVGLYFSSLHWIKSNFGSADPHPLESVCIGAMARSLSGLILLPVTVVKTRFESGFFRYRGIGHALVHIYGTEGYRGLYSGLSATLLRDAPFSGLYLMFYTQMKKSAQTNGLSPSHPLIHFSCGIFAGTLASLVTQPADVIKTNMQLYPDRHNSTRKVIEHIYKTEGLVGFQRGILPRCIRRTLMAAMAWTVYEQLMKSFGVAT